MIYNNIAVTGDILLIILTYSILQCDSNTFSYVKYLKLILLPEIDFSLRSKSKQQIYRLVVFTKGQTLPKHSLPTFPTMSLSPVFVRPSLSTNFQHIVKTRVPWVCPKMSQSPSRDNSDDIIITSSGVVLQKKSSTRATKDIMSVFIINRSRPLMCKLSGVLV